MTDILIIEDELPAYQNLCRFILKTGGDYQIIDWQKSIEQSVRWLSGNPHPDLIFLDVQLSDGNAFEIFEQVSIQCPIIFSTAFDEYALKAFELNSVDYLLKPITFQTVDKALKKFHRDHASKNADKQLIHNLLRDIAVLQKSYTEKFLVKRGDELISLPSKNIAYFYADEATFCVADNGRIYSLNKSLSHLNESLDPDLFFRLNRKIVCHIDALIDVRRSFGNKLKISLRHAPDFDIFVSREKVTAFKKWYGVT